MKNIVICNQKGGVGKSLIADELSFSLERSNIPMNFYDLDSQGGTIHKTKEKPEAEVSVVDTPGALQRELTQWIMAADVVVVPTRPTSRDIAPLMRMRDAIISSDALSRTTLIVNCWNRFRASRDFMNLLESINFPTILRMPQSEMYVQASAATKSVVTYAPHSRAAKATINVCNAIRTAAGLSTENVK